jgi:hypothetical protein
MPRLKRGSCRRVDADVDDAAHGIDHGDDGVDRRPASTERGRRCADRRRLDTQDVLLAPLEAGVIPLPHQLHVLTLARRS